jgi:hypothetical protein
MSRSEFFSQSQIAEDTAVIPSSIKTHSDLCNTTGFRLLYVK